jgi:hypothetical protein
LGFELRGSRIAPFKFIDGYYLGNFLARKL